MGLQVPTRPAMLQASQAAPQAVLQHTPSMQLPLTHWLLPPQATPLASLGMQVLVLQKSPAMQLASVAQVAGQVAAAPLHTYGVQEGVPEEPSGRLVQVPSEPTTLQPSQARPQAALQQ